MRAHQDNSNNKFRAPSENAVNQQVIRLQISNGIATDETVLYTNTGASNNFDEYDSQKMSNNSASIPEIYTVAGSEQLSINGMNTIPNDTEFPIGFTTGQSNTFTFRASQFSNFITGTQLILHDNLLNISQDLAIADYSFTSNATTNNTSRFSLVLHAPSVATGINPDMNDKMWISSHNGQLFVSGGEGTVLTVYSSVGQKLSTKTLKSTSVVLDNILTPGVYMVTLSNDGKTITKKVIID